MPWLQITVVTSPDFSETVENVLTEFGALSITCMDHRDDPIYEPELDTTPLWQQTRVTGLFEETISSSDVLTAINAALINPPAPDHILLERIEDQAWERAWLEHFKPINFGERLCICPFNHTPPDEHKTIIWLDPGLAFGTGTHPTTALCLEWLDGKVSEGMSVCDYGCGSGILALAAAKLGADNVTAIDNDPQAIEATEVNALKNSVNQLIYTSLPEFEAEAPFDLVVANILAEPLKHLAPTLSSLCRPGGQIALSGLLEEQTNALIEAYSPWFKLDPVSTKDGWARISGTRIQSDLV